MPRPIVDKILYILNRVLLVIVIYLLIDRYIDYKLAGFANSYFQELIRLGLDYSWGESSLSRVAN